MMWFVGCRYVDGILEAGGATTMGSVSNILPNIGIGQDGTLANTAVHKGTWIDEV